MKNYTSDYETPPSSPEHPIENGTGPITINKAPFRILPTTQVCAISAIGPVRRKRRGDITAMIIDFKMTYFCHPLIGVGLPVANIFFLKLFVSKYSQSKSSLFVAKLCKLTRGKLELGCLKDCIFLNKGLLE